MKPRYLIVVCTLSALIVSGCSRSDLHQGAQWTCYHEASAGKGIGAGTWWERLDFRVLVVPNSASADEFVLEITRFLPNTADIMAGVNPPQQTYVRLSGDNNPFRLILNADRTFKSVEFLRHGKWARFDMQFPQFVKELFPDRVFSVTYPSKPGGAETLPTQPVNPQDKKHNK